MSHLFWLDQEHVKPTDLAALRTNMQRPQQATAKNRLGETFLLLLTCRKVGGRIQLSSLFSTKRTKNAQY